MERRLQIDTPSNTERNYECSFAASGGPTYRTKPNRFDASVESPPQFARKCRRSDGQADPFSSRRARLDKPRRLFMKPRQCVALPLDQRQENAGASMVAGLNCQCQQELSSPRWIVFPKRSRICRSRFFHPRPRCAKIPCSCPRCIPDLPISIQRPWQVSR